jgi:amidophosphoribosyltransferase
MENLCRACFDGVYPVGVPEPALAQQGQQATDGTTTPPDAALLGGAGAVDALSRP